MTKVAELKETPTMELHKKLDIASGFARWDFSRNGGKLTLSYDIPEETNDWDHPWIPYRFASKIREFIESNGLSKWVSYKEVGLNTSSSGHNGEALITIRADNLAELEQVIERITGAEGYQQLMTNMMLVACPGTGLFDMLNHWPSMEVQAKAEGKTLEDWQAKKQAEADAYYDTPEGKKSIQDGEQISKYIDGFQTTKQAIDAMVSGTLMVGESDDLSGDRQAVFDNFLNDVAQRKPGLARYIQQARQKHSEAAGNKGATAATRSTPDSAAVWGITVYPQAVRVPEPGTLPVWRRN